MPPHLKFFIHGNGHTIGPRNITAPTSPQLNIPIPFKYPIWAFAVGFIVVLTFTLMCGLFSTVLHRRTHKKAPQSMDNLTEAQLDGSAKGTGATLLVEESIMVSRTTSMTVEAGSSSLRNVVGGTMGMAYPLIRTECNVTAPNDVAAVHEITKPKKCLMARTRGICRSTRDRKGKQVLRETPPPLQSFEMHRMDFMAS